jgi:Zn-dependent protease
MNENEIAMGMLWYLVFLFSLTCHEAAHAFAALRGGDPTAARGGQASLNPAPHMRREPMGTIGVPILSYFMGGFMIGWASAPLDPHWRHQHPHRAAWVALAGPAANFAIAGVAAGCMVIGLKLGWLALPEHGSLTTSQLVVTASGESTALTGILSIAYVLNLLLGVFNLLPVPPLDGATGIGLLVSKDNARRITRWLSNPTVALLGILIAWSLVGDIFPPILHVTLDWILSTG